MHQCLNDGFVWSTTPSLTLQGCGCPKCAGVLKRTHEEYVNELSVYNPTIEVVEEYIDVKTPILHHCTAHDVFWNTTPERALCGAGCPTCKKERLRAHNLKSHEQYVCDVADNNPDVIVLDTYIDAKTPIKHYCKQHNIVWYASPTSVLRGCGCPQCNESFGEKQIRQWLQLNKVEYVYQKTFNDCRDIKPLPFDFYIPKYNLCIEYDGGQHFKPVNFSGKGEEWTLQQFAKIQLHDTIKDEYCKNNNITLLRVPYFKNIEEELEQFFIHLI